MGKSIRIILAGGGSGGPVSPLLAVAAEIKKTHPGAVFLLVGGRYGPEKQMAEEAGMGFMPIVCGKWRRYFSLQNFLAPFLTLWGLLSAIFLLKKFRPHAVFGAGSFYQVPVIWAAWILRIPSVIHQQDIQPSLANRLTSLAREKITVSFEKSLTDFSAGAGIFYKSSAEEKVILTGNPFREELAGITREKGIRHFNLKSEMPVLLVLGGGTGSDFINKLIFKALPELSKFVQVLHSYGGRKVPDTGRNENYKAYPFIGDMGKAYAAADFVLSRAGLSTITELSNLDKISIIIPIPETHQEYNGFVLDKLKAALVLKQQSATPEILIKLLKRVMFDISVQKIIKENIAKIMPKNSAKKIGKILTRVAEDHAK